MKKIIFLFIFSFVFYLNVDAQQKKTAKPISVTKAKPELSGPISERKIIPADTDYHEFEEDKEGEHRSNKIIPGKGLPKFKDPVLQSKMGKLQSRAAIRTFDAAVTSSRPSDPTGAIGPNHYVNAWNRAFSIWDKNGNQLVPPASLFTIGGEFNTDNVTDPNVIYDEAADRFIMMIWALSPNRLLLAVSQGPNPVTDGWYTYSFPVGSINPDFPKISVWSDGYYITTNSNPLHVETENNPSVFVVERDKVLNGEDASMISFPLPGINTYGFYSPAGFHSVGPELPPPGNAPIIYLQDDAWQGISEDHLKLWLINVNWNIPMISSIELSQQLGSADGVSPFESNFDQGDFSNLSQPRGPDVDALQGMMMYMTQYRRFSDHNSVVMNFVVDTEPGSEVEHAGIRWYELRQSKYGEPWTVYQEGTYAPDNSDRFCGSIALDIRGNIGLGFTIIDDSQENPIFPSLHYTGRYADDPLGQMTVEEQVIFDGKSEDPSPRYGDYAHIYVDPTDGITFWHNGEVFNGLQRINKVGIFQIGVEDPYDLGVVDIVAPMDATFTNSEPVTVKVRNYGTTSQTNYQLSYSINGGPAVSQTFNEPINPGESAELTLDQTADLSEGDTFEITVTVNLTNDVNDYNDSLTIEVKNLLPKDVGVTSIIVPESGLVNNTPENVTVILENLGGQPQQDIPLYYRLNLNSPVRETYNGTLGVGEEKVYTFSQRVDLTSPGQYYIKSGTDLEGDMNTSNDATTKTFAKLDCIPDGSDCGLGDGLTYFELEELINEAIPCSTGYNDFLGIPSATLDRADRTYTVTVKSGFAEEDAERFSMWIDFNDNGFFEDSERVITSEVITEADTKLSYEFSLPADAPLGEHVLRVRAGDVRYPVDMENPDDLNNPCQVMKYGTTHDYTIAITDSKMDIENSILKDSELVVVTEGDDQFRIILKTFIEEPMEISVYNMLGQRMVYGEMERETSLAQEYELDMSYAARGVYLVRVGTDKFGKVKRFIVK